MAGSAVSSDHALQDRLALHTWTLDSTPLVEVLRIVPRAGWNAVELRHADFTRAFESGVSRLDVIELVRESRVKVATLGAEYGWMFATGSEQRRLFAALAETCETANALGCDTIMSATGQGSGSVREAAAALREAGGIVEAYGLRLAWEYSSQHERINRLDLARDILAAAGHTRCGLLLDTYHLERSGSGGRGFENVPASDIFAFQYSDVPATPAPGGLRPADRLPPGSGSVRWREVFGLLLEKGYAGYLSYEAPNPVAWSRPPEAVAREAASATRALLEDASREWNLRQH
jgi:2-keto-myo-inositol isomerase